VADPSNTRCCPQQPSRSFNRAAGEFAWPSGTRQTFFCDILVGQTTDPGVLPKARRGTPWARAKTFTEAVSLGFLAKML
jgi:hypothetical protein